MKTAYRNELILIFVVLFLSSIFSSCQEEGEIDDVVKSYTVEFYDYNNQMISSQTIKTIDEIDYPTLRGFILDGQHYSFLGWDSNQDETVDTLTEVTANLFIRPIFIILDEYTITYSLNNSEEQLTISSIEAFTLELPTSDNYFLGYYDQENNPITDENGKKLPYVTISKDTTLTPKYLVEGETVYMFELPKNVVDGDLVLEIDDAIEEGLISTDLDSESENKFISESTFIYNGVKYERVVATTSRNNIFHNRTHITRGETYYFQYLPVECEVVIADYENNLFQVLTNETVGVGIFNTYNLDYAHSGIHMVVLQNTNKFIDNYFTNSSAFTVHHPLVQDPFRPFSVSSYLPTRAQIKNTQKELNDYLLATTDIEVSYEYGSIFCASFLTDDVISIESEGTPVYGYDCYGNQQELYVKNRQYGQLCVYEFEINKPNESN